MKRDCSLCSKVSGVSASEGRTSEDGWTPSTFTNFRVKVGAHHYGFRHCTAHSSKGNNLIWVIVDRLIKLAHFIPFRLGQSTGLLAESICRRWFDCMLCQSASCPTEIPDFYLTFGKVFKRAWGDN